MLIKSSRTMSNSAEVALTVAQDVYKEDHFRIIIEKYGASVKKNKKQNDIETLRNGLRYWEIFERL